MTHELKSLRRQKVIYDNANATNKLVYQLVIEGKKVTPTSGKITIYRRGVSTALVTAANMTVSGTLLTYAVDTTTEASWPIETGYRAEISVTYAAAAYLRTIHFDVVKYLLDLSIGLDQLVDLDSNVAGMSHNGDDDLRGPIIAARAVITARVEAKVHEDGKLVENMILDESPLSVCACFYVLSILYLDRQNLEKHRIFAEQFESLLAAVLSTIRYDTGEDGEEDSDFGGIQQTRLVT